MNLWYPCLGALWLVALILAAGSGLNFSIFSEGKLLIGWILLMYAYVLVPHVFGAARGGRAWEDALPLCLAALAVSLHGVFVGFLALTSAQGQDSGQIVTAAVLWVIAILLNHWRIRIRRRSAQKKSSNAHPG